jgi:hypothetical protein
MPDGQKTDGFRVQPRSVQEYPSGLPSFLVFDAARYFSTLRMMLFFETPKARTMSTWRHAPRQISCAENIREERRSFSGC